MFKLKSIPKNIGGKKVLLRADLNMPVSGGKISDLFRLIKILPTIKMLLGRRAKVILMSHFELDGDCPSFGKIFPELRREIKNLKFVNQVAGPAVKKAADSLGPGEILLIENLRLNPGEKKNSPIFAKKLAGLGDIYVNEAFSASHRGHASIVGIPKFLKSYAGPLLEAEVKNLSRAFVPPHPFFLVFGGKKFSDKAPIIKKFFKKADKILIGGSLAAILLHCRGYKVKTPEFSKKDLHFCNKIKNSGKLVTVQDVYAPGKKVIIVGDLKGEAVYDLGPKTMREAADFIKKANLVLWNGTLGITEKGFIYGSKTLAESLVKIGPRVIAGGGDTAAFLRKYKFDKKFGFISTGGGAMLEFLAKGTLPGIEALKK